MGMPLRTWLSPSTTAFVQMPITSIRQMNPPPALTWRLWNACSTCTVDAWVRLLLSGRTFGLVYVVLGGARYLYRQPLRQLSALLKSLSRAASEQQSCGQACKDVLRHAGQKAGVQAYPLENSWTHSE